ncbi:ABC transporter ATP-binding protein [Roseitranquillus sediminis]|uniref:ABC transporter ATP-binding protein n=1 Tax=Roseitranquillus sediminis TaxID=2809051 RepID=UPI001D0C7B0C|nr:ABC transporter ATP-binding protein [Roseitranquillus sediminis]MBM9595956.1 ABC transporter ATP-binding protein [Roseitranquillus sediminis]
MTKEQSTDAGGIRVRGLSKQYGRVKALDNVDLDVRAGDVFALLGPNGAGKTTLLHILCTILRPDRADEVTVAGHDAIRHSLRAREAIGVVFQEPSLDDRLTLRENLEFHGMVYEVPRSLRRRRMDELLELVDLVERRDDLVRKLSSGMKRRLEIARALLHDPRILFLDEPTVGLDAQSRERIWRYLEELRASRDLTIVVTTHYIDEVKGCDQVCIIDHGRILAEGTPDDLRGRFGTETVRVTPTDIAAAEAIRETYPTATSGRGDTLLIPITDAAMKAEFLRRCGIHVRDLAFETPSLESVFLSLTGHDIRDSEADARDVTLAFGRQGGELTR